MLDNNKLKQIIEYHKPDFIVPEVEAIETQISKIAEAEDKLETIKRHFKN